MSSRKWDVIISELNLPDSIGIETLQSLLNHANKVPILILTGNCDEAVVYSVHEAGVDNFLCKSRMDAETLQRAVLNTMDPEKAKPFIDLRNKLQHGQFYFDT